MAVFRVFFLVFWFGAGVVQAGDRPLENDLDRFSGEEPIPLVLTPARLRQPHSEVPASVTVIDRELIEASGARELYDLLKLVPGMGAAKVDGNLPTVAYHGGQALDDRRMLVLIDGRSVYQPGLARVQWNGLPVSVDDVARIEVTRGPNSAAYGANAFSGVINIITLHPRDVSGTTLEVRHGNNGISDHRYTRGASRGMASVRFTVEQRNDDGYDDGFDRDHDEHLYRDAKTQNLANLRAAFDLTDRDTLEFLAGGSQTSLERPRDDDFQMFTRYQEPPEDNNERVFAQLRWRRQFSPTHSLRAEIYSQYFNGRQEMALCGKSPMAAFGGGASDFATGAIWFTKEVRDFYLQSGDINATVNAVVTRSDPAIDDRLTVLENSGAGYYCGDYAFDVKEKRHDIEIEDTIHFGDRAKLVAGLNLRHDRAESETYLSGTADNFSQRLFGTLEVKVADPVLVNVGGFWEQEDISGEFFNPRGAVIVKPLEGHSIRAVYSEAVRTSDIFEDQANTNLHTHNLLPPYSDNTVGLLGWSDPRFFVTQESPGGLDPERIISRELGYYGLFGALELDLRFFEEELRDLLTRGMNPFEFDAETRDEMDLSGWESQMTWRPHPAHLLRLTNAHIHQEASTKVLERFAPRDSGSFLWRYDVDRNLMLSAAYYVAHDWNRDGNSAKATEFERTDLVVALNFPISTSVLRLEGKVQHFLNSNPVVFEENRYADRQRYWLSASLEF